MTLPYDRQRLPYRTDAETVDRRCAFIGTMNEGSVMPHDPSGSTRWICVECPGSCDVETLFADDTYREQLYAEAKLLVSTPAFAKGIDRQLLEAQNEANLEHTESNEVYDQAAEMARDLGYTMQKLLELAEAVGLLEHNNDGTKREFTMRQQKDFTNSLRKVRLYAEALRQQAVQGKILVFAVIKSCTRYPVCTPVFNKRHYLYIYIFINKGNRGLEGVTGEVLAYGPSSTQP